METRGKTSQNENVTEEIVIEIEEGERANEQIEEAHTAETLNESPTYNVCLAFACYL